MSVVRRVNKANEEKGEIKYCKKSMQIVCSDAYKLVSGKRSQDFSMRFDSAGCFNYKTI